MGYCGWFLEDDERERLLTLFPSVYSDAVANHVTLAHANDSEIALPPQRHFEIIGTVDDKAGLQALVVAVDGDVIRPDGRLFHMTWSLDRSLGRRSVQSNDVLAAQGFTLIDQSVPFIAEPGLRETAST